LSAIRPRVHSLAEILRLTAHILIMQRRARWSNTQLELTTKLNQEWETLFIKQHGTLTITIEDYGYIFSVWNNTSDIFHCPVR
jgi:hypothetical protein